MYISDKIMQVCLITALIVKRYNGPLKMDLFLACCLPFDQVDLVVHIFTVHII
jgi:hypothetical protein